MAFVLGVDPGKSGGLALLDPLGVPVRVTKMPVTDGDLAIWLAAARRDVLEHSDAALPPLRAFVEDVWCSPQMGVKSAFTFGKEVGRLRMALRGTGIRYDLVLPIKWQTALACRTRGDKSITYREAAARFPMITVTHAIADALLIAEYGRRQLLAGIPPAPPRPGQRRRR